MAFLCLPGLGLAQIITLNGTFTGATLDSGWTVGGTGYTPTLTAASGGTDMPGSGWLQLTSSATNEATYALDTTSFASANATITATFNYAAFNGSGADGITFFLADASQPFAVGAYGGSLGYAQKTIAGGGGANINGMSGGYIGLGIDEYGNYSNPTEGRSGGTGFTPNAIAVRGPGSGLTGYNYLGGTNGSGTALAFPGSSTRPTGANQRTIQITITATNQLTVSLAVGGSTVFTPLYSIDLSGYARPNNLVMGFTASTGGATDIHQVQAVKLTSSIANLWTNTAGTNNWGAQGMTTDDTNWASSPAANPTVGSDILLDNTYVSSAQTIAVSGNQKVRNLQIDAPFSYTLNGGSLELTTSAAAGPSGIFVTQTHGTAAQTINSAITADNAIEVKNSTTSLLTLGGTVGLGANSVTFDGTGATTVSGVVSGTGSVVQNAAGTTTLSGANTYSGGTSISAGTLNANNATALGTAGVTLSGGILGSTNSSSVSNAVTLTGNAGLTGITSGGTLTQSGGSYTLNMENATQSGTLNLSDSGTARTLTVQTDAGTSTISGTIANGSTSTGDALVKTGAGTLVLSGSNTYTGSTTINAGTLDFSHTGSAYAGNITLNAGTLGLGASNAISSSSNLTLNGGTIAMNGYSDYVGSLTINGATNLDFGAAATDAFVFKGLTDSTNAVLTVLNYSGSGTALATTTKSLSASLVNDVYFAGYGSGSVEATTSSLNDGVTSYLITPNTTYLTWNGGSSVDSNWTSGGAGGNWSGSTVSTSPTSTQKLDFGGTVRTGPVMNGNYSANAIRFDTTAGAFSIAESGNTLTLYGTLPSIIQDSANAQSINGGTIALGSSSVIDVTGAGALSIGSVISGANALTKVGVGTLNLSGANTFSGGLSIANGTVGVSTNNAALGTGAVTVSSGATLQVNDGRTLTNALTISGTGAINGAIDSNPGSGNTATLSGAVTLGADSKISSDSGTLALSGGISGSGKNLTIAGAGNVNVSSAITTGAGGLTLSGTGTTTLSGANTYTGTTTVNSGTLNLSGTAGTPTIQGALTVAGGTVTQTTSGQINSASSVAVTSGTLNVNAAQTLTTLSVSSGANLGLGSGAALTLNNAGTVTLNGTISGAGSLVTTNTGTTVITGSNTYSGGTNSSSIININNGSALGTGTLTETSGGNLQVSNNVTVANALNLASTGTSFAGAIENVSGSNTFTGALTASGTTRLQSDTGTLTMSGAASLSGNTLNVGGNSNTVISGAISGTSGSALTKDGTGTLTLGAANSSFLGSVSVTAGTLNTTVSGALNSANTVSISSGASLGIFATSQSVGALTENGTLSLSGGTLTLNGASSLGSSAILSGSGTLILNAGSSLSLGTNFNDSGLNIVLNGGTLTLAGTTDTFGSLTVDATSTLDFTGGSKVTFSSVSLASSDLLDVTGWANTADYFYSVANPGTMGSNPINQIIFPGASYPDQQTHWNSSTGEITPAPEPATYGALFVGACLAGCLVLRNRRRTVPSRG